MVLVLAGTMWTASSHIITAVIGSGVLSLAWATAQLGWIAGPAVMILFSFVTYYTSSLLSVCYRSGDSITGKRNYTYMDAVRSNLGMFIFLFSQLNCEVSFYSEKKLLKLNRLKFQVELRSKFVDLFSTWIFLELPLVTQ